MTEMQRDPELASRLQKASEELKDLEQQIKTGMIDVRVLVDFREAVNHARHTAWAIQRWVEEEQKAGGKPYTVITMVMAERMRIATELSRDLSIDIERGDIDFETPGIVDLHRVTKELLTHLERFVHS